MSIMGHFQPVVLSNFLPKSPMRDAHAVMGIRDGPALPVARGGASASKSPLPSGISVAGDPTCRIADRQGGYPKGARCPSWCRQQSSACRGLAHHRARLARVANHVRRETRLVSRRAAENLSKKVGCCSRLSTRDSCPAVAIRGYQHRLWCMWRATYTVLKHWQ
jgi:hypothetical protein